MAEQKIPQARLDVTCEHPVMSEARVAFLVALENWLETDPEPSDIRYEIEHAHGMIDLTLELWQIGRSLDGAAP